MPTWWPAHLGGYQIYAVKHHYHSCNLVFRKSRIQEIMRFLSLRVSAIYFYADLNIRLYLPIFWLQWSPLASPYLKSKECQWGLSFTSCFRFGVQFKPSGLTRDTSSCFHLSHLPLNFYMLHCTLMVPNILVSQIFWLDKYFGQTNNLVSQMFW